MNKRKPTFLDLFAGAGGLSEGFLNNGYIDIAHIEMNHAACETLKTRQAYHFLKQANNMTPYYNYLRGLISKSDLYQIVPETIFHSVINWTISKDTMGDLYKKIDNLKREKKIRKIDVIIGGPPCQAYSLVGRARSENNMSTDPRNHLYELYCEMLDYYKPKMFVFENVCGIYTANEGKYFEDLKKRIDEIGYEVKDKLLEFSEYGVLQKRKRVILIGWKKGSGMKYPDFKKGPKLYTISDLFADLPVLNPGDSCTVYSTNNINQCLIDTKIRNENDVLTLNAARHLNAHDAEIYKMVINKWDNESVRFKYTDLDEKKRTHKNISCFLDRFKVIGANLHASQTIVAHLSKDGHYFIHPDINQCRSITVREAARIQSFPDDYFFEGNRTSQFTQVGNAVPPLISNMIAKELLKELD